MNILSNRIRSPHIKKYLKNTSWLFADNFVKQAVNVGVGIFLARYLKPQGLGTISYVLTFMQIIMPLALLGLNAIVIKNIVQGKYAAKNVISTAFFIKVIASLISLCTLVLIAMFFETDSLVQESMMIIGLSYLFYPIQVIDFYFQAKLQSKYYVISQQISTVLCALFRVAGIIFQFEIEFFVWIYVVEVFISSTVSFFFYKKVKMQLISLLFDFQLGKLILKEAFPIIFTSFFIVFYMKIDQLMIKEILDMKSLGNFSAAVKLSEAFYVIPSILCVSLFPAIINGLSISREEYMIRMKKLYSLFILVSVGASLLVLLSGDFVILLLYGSDYFAAGQVLKIHFFNSIFLFLGVAYSQAFIAEGIQRYTTINTILGAGLNIVLNLVLIPRFGIIGAAVSTLFAQFYSGFFCLLFFKRTRPHFLAMLESMNIIKTIRIYLSYNKYSEST